MIEYIKKISPVFDHLFKSIKRIGKNMDVPIIKDETVLYLVTLIQVYNPKKILELGSGLAYSTHTFSKYSSSDSRITSVDLSIETIERCKSILSVSNYLYKINWVHSDALEFLKNDKLDYDLYFVDALKSDYPDYFDVILNNAVGNYIILFDNLYMDGRVGDKTDKRGVIIDHFNRSMFQNRKGKFNFMPVGDGLGVFIMRNYE